MEGKAVFGPIDCVWAPRDITAGLHCWSPPGFRNIFSYIPYKLQVNNDKFVFAENQGTDCAYFVYFQTRRNIHIISKTTV